MLREKQVQFSDSTDRYWFARMFTDPDSLLTVYYDRDRHPLQFTYMEGTRTDIKTCLQWSPEGKLKYYQIDSGEASPLANLSPVATGTLPFDGERFLKLFDQKAREIDPDLRDWLLQRVRENLE